MMPIGAKAVIAYWLAAAVWSWCHRKDGQTLSEGAAWLLKHKWYRIPTVSVTTMTLAHIVTMAREPEPEPLDLERFRQLGRFGWM